MGAPPAFCRSIAAAGKSFPALRRNGYEVIYREFAGGHEVPNGVARDAMLWAVATA
jgi:phospholipase/carboxylesterase